MILFVCLFFAMFPLVYFGLMKEFFVVGDVIVLGKNDVFKFNYPTEAAKMREKRRSGLLVTVSICTIGLWEKSAILKKILIQCSRSVSHIVFLIPKESTESLINFHISPVRGSHGDLSTRSDVSSPVTLDSG